MATIAAPIESASSGLAARLKSNLLPAAVWTFLFYMQVARFDFPPALPNLLIGVINAICVVLFLFRSDPKKTGTPGEMGIALSGTFITAFVPEATHVTVFATAVQVVGLVAWAAALIALGRSLGIAPADRGLKSRGAYAIVRHPVYASELVFWVGFALSSPTGFTALVLATWWGLQVVRILHEERLIEGYEAYKRSVRWRVVPGLW
jgi:protein-S-isoprenylcysteine O-methyltransferase Ste14